MSHPPPTSAMQQMQLRNNSSMANNNGMVTETGADATAIGHNGAASLTNADSSPGTIKKETTLFVKIEVLSLSDVSQWLCNATTSDDSLLFSGYHDGILHHGTECSHMEASGRKTCQHLWDARSQRHGFNSR